MIKYISMPMLRVSNCVQHSLSPRFGLAILREVYLPWMKKKAIVII